MKSTLKCDSHNCGQPGFLAGASLAAALLLAASTSQADNILVNTNFAEPPGGGQKIPTGWIYFDDPTVPASTEDYWIGGTNTGGFYAVPLSGTQYWKEWGAGYFSTLNNVAGIYQEFGSSPGSAYQASGWFYTSSSDELGNPTFNSYVWIDVSV